jgi:hypothetical protein
MSQLEKCKFYLGGVCQLTGVTCYPSPFCGYTPKSVKVKSTNLDVS